LLDSTSICDSILLNGQTIPKKPTLREEGAESSGSLKRWPSYRRKKPLVCPAFYFALHPGAPGEYAEKSDSKPWQFEEFARRPRKKKGVVLMIVQSGLGF